MKGKAMKKLIVLLAGLLLSVGGCGSPLLDIGGGVAAGSLLSNTMTGMEKDLEVKEAKLIELYNKGVEDGAQKESLDQIEKDIYDTRLAKQTVKTGKELLGVDWNDPKETGGAIFSIGALAYAYIKRRGMAEMSKKYKSHKQGEDRFKINNPDKAKELYANIGEARTINKVT